MSALAGFDDDLDAAMAATPDEIVLPVRNGADVQHLGVKLAVREAELGLADGATRIIALVAGPGAVFQLGSFVSASPRLAALAFDARAFATSLGIEDLTARPGSASRAISRSLRPKPLASRLFSSMHQQIQPRSTKRRSAMASTLSSCAIPPTSPSPARRSSKSAIPRTW